jgi:hypothetical protein
MMKSAVECAARHDERSESLSELCCIDQTMIDEFFNRYISNLCGFLLLNVCTKYYQWLKITFSNLSVFLIPLSQDFAIFDKSADVTLN